METNNIKYWKWAVIILIVLNIFTVGSFIYHRYSETKKPSPSISIDSTDDGNPINGRYFKNEVGFDDNQMEKFRGINRTFNHKANKIIYGLDSLKTELYTELNTPTPDTVKLNTLSDEIGLNHAQLKKITNSYYLNIKSIATPQQNEKIKTAFYKLYTDEDVHARRKHNHRGRGKHYQEN